ncbi:MAG: peptide chain release factor N(5)-glutamine methyltransferase, partial [Ardenticatenales bacterium]
AVDPAVAPLRASFAGSLADALRAAAAVLASDPHPMATARFLAGHALALTPDAVLARLRDPFPAAARAAFDASVRRVADGEPLAYVLGDQPFLDFALTVTPDVLIPRPETEALALWAIKWAIEWANARRAATAAPLRAADVGTGSGALAIALARALPDGMIVAGDVSPAALAVAADNADRLCGAGRVAFVEGDLFAPFNGSLQGPFDLIVANLPYVGTDEIGDVAPSVLAFEPHGALFAGADGLDLLRRLIADLPGRLVPGGAAALEIGWRQGERVLALAADAFPSAIVTLRDDPFGRPRFVTIETAR